MQFFQQFFRVSGDLIGHYSFGLKFYYLIKQVQRCTSHCTKVHILWLIECIWGHRQFAILLWYRILLYYKNNLFLIQIIYIPTKFSQHNTQETVYLKEVSISAKKYSLNVNFQIFVFKVLITRWTSKYYSTNYECTLLFLSINQLKLSFQNEHVNEIALLNDYLIFQDFLIF